MSIKIDNQNNSKYDDTFQMNKINTGEYNIHF